MDQAMMNGCCDLLLDLYDGDGDLTRLRLHWIDPQKTLNISCAETFFFVCFYVGIKDCVCVTAGRALYAAS